MKDCGRYFVASEAKVVRGKRNAYYVGIRSCGLAHICPVCGPRIAARRAKEIGVLEDKWQQEGGHIIMLTLTVPHSSVEKLTDVFGKFGCRKKETEQYA